MFKFKKLYRLKHYCFWLIQSTPTRRIILKRIILYINKQLIAIKIN